MRPGRRSPGIRPENFLVVSDEAVRFNEAGAKKPRNF